MQERGFGGGLGDVVLLSLAGTRAAGFDAPAVLVALDVDLPFTLAAGEGVGGALLDITVAVWTVVPKIINCSEEQSEAPGHTGQVAIAGQ
ncbi:hypothetical protein J7F03_39405 [Streptomyces sp. ISL-43]|uniref:hypothetical protein n=1 Tax=Streptomyces sp. ISL-43 TaxID=2819183 RepID=UPI001BE517E2|nr:hypothetical protein [Streptomyces sp. ISL-43]